VERREGTGHSDVVRLQSRGKLRRVWRHRERPLSENPRLRGNLEKTRNVANPMAGWGVQQTPKLSMRSKPSKPGGTARTERARKVAYPSRRSHGLL
jgi:hypothetical protein